MHRVVKRALLIRTIELSSLTRSRAFAVSPERGPFSAELSFGEWGEF